jgi:hypothetical protein
MLDITDIDYNPPYTKVDIGRVKTTTRIKRGEPQLIRLFTKSQRKLIIKAVEDRPDTMTIEDILREYGVLPGVFYTWIRSNNRREYEKEKKILDIPKEKQITDYKIVTGGSPEVLADKVQASIVNGWKPVGSHTVVTTNTTQRYSGSQNTGSHSTFEYCQTMIKE